MDKDCFNCGDTCNVSWSEEHNEFFCEDCLEYSMKEECVVSKKGEIQNG